MEKERQLKAEELIDYISSSPSPFHAVENIRGILIDNGFTELEEKKPFNVKRGGKYFVKRASSALIAFTIPDNPTSFHIVAAHTDSPCFKIKWNPVVSASGVPSRLNTETYGGLLIYTWFDRPLSVAGRVFTKKGETLVDFKDKLNLVIPSLAIHQNREANNGWKISPQKEMLPLLGDGDVEFMKVISDECNCDADDIIDYDLFLYNNTPAFFSGVNGEYFSSPKIDDLECAYTAVRGLLSSGSDSSINMVTLFDNEETGSGTRQGALSDFLNATVERIALSLGWNTEEKYMALSSSFMLSADNGHAVHPAYPEKSDITNRPRMNGGVLLKYAASQKYTTNAETGAFVRTLLEKNNIPYQIFFNHSDLPGGSTLGNLSTEKVSIPTADIGVAQLAMHSSYETAGTEDVKTLIDFFSSFFAL